MAEHHISVATSSLSKTETNDSEATSPLSKETVDDIELGPATVEDQSIHVAIDTANIVGLDQNDKVEENLEAPRGDNNDIEAEHIASQTVEPGRINPEINPFVADAPVVDDDASFVFIEDDNADQYGDNMNASTQGNDLDAMEEAKLNSAAETQRSVISAGLESLKYLFSLALVLFCAITVAACITTGQTKAHDYGIHPAAAFVIFCFVIFWLGAIEGGQGCLVGLQPVEKHLYEETHPITHKCTVLVHKGDNMERFIVGRQFLAVLIIFVANMMGTATTGANVLGLDNVSAEIFLGTGIALMLTTIVIGQLTAQVNAANCMLDFINNYFMLFSSYLSLAIEFSGMLHSVYLVQTIFTMITGEAVKSNEPPRSSLSKLFFWCRVVMSLGVLSFALAVTLKALFDGNSGMWEGVPASASVVIFFLLLAFVGMMEGMQIAAFILLNMPEEDLKSHSIAYRNSQLMFSGQNLQAFLIGRQICVALCMFIVARIATVSIPEGEENIFGLPDAFQSFIDTGLLGSIVLTILGSLAWRIVASSFPLAFMSNPLIYAIIRLCLILEYSGVCSASWVLARYHKILVGYQPDDVHLDGSPKHTSVPVTRRDKDIDGVVVVTKYIYSLVLISFCVIVVLASIFTKQTLSGEAGIHPVLGFFIFVFVIMWLAMIEGGQGCLIGLHPIEPSKYATSHPKASKCTKLVHKGDNTERFIVGRQFLAVLIIFVANSMGTAAPGAEVLGLPKIMNEIFLGTGVALMLTTIAVGQLTSQVNAATCMLDFINNYFMLFSSYVSLAIEFSGLLHSVYLVQIFFAKISGIDIQSNEPSRTPSQQAFFVGRIILSFGVLSFSLAVTLKALFDGNSGMWEGVPASASVVIFFLLLAFVGLLEGMQIAAFALLNLPEEELKSSTIAYKNCELMFSGQNLQAFLIGRQICAALCMFIVARIATVSIPEGGANIFGLPDGFQAFIDTGLLGSIVLTILGSLAWRIVASSFPMAFMSNPLIYVIIRLCLILEKTGICAASWVFARQHKLIAGFQPDAVYLEGAPRHTSAPVTKRDKDIDVTIDVVKYLYSFALLFFCITVIMALVFTEQTNLAELIHPVGIFFLFWFLIFWLAMMEGGQGCLVGLEPVDKNLYSNTHKITLKNTNLAHKGDNMERFIVGRQFLVVLVTFMLSLCVSPVVDVSVFGFPDGITAIFLGNGVALMLTTIIVGQLTSQINAAVCMLDFINNYFMLFTSYVSFAIEFSGLLHSVYLVQIMFAKITKTPIESSEPPRSLMASIFFWGRVLMSLCVLFFALAVTLKALFDGYSGMWDGVPNWASVIIFFLLLAFVGMMEGMQIAAFALLNFPEDKLAEKKVAYANCILMFSGSNLQAFLIGRQICVASCMFIVARIATVSIPEGENNIFDFSDNFQAFIDTGLLGSVVLTILGSLAWRVIASSFPLAFMSNPLIYLIIRLCLLLESTGVCSAAWVLALVQKAVVGYKPDTFYYENNLSSKSRSTDEEADINPQEIMIAPSKSFDALM